MARVTLVEALPWDPLTGSVVPVRLAGGGRRHYRHKGHADWLAGIVDAPVLTAGLEFDGSFTGGAVPSSSAIGFMPARADARARIARLMWVGAPIVVSTGDDAATVPAWTVELNGKVAGYSVQRGAFTFTIANLAGRLNDALVTATFTGKGGIEGSAQAAGRLKRRTWGRAWSVEGRLLDAPNNIYEFGDPAHPIRAFDAVKDKGRAGPAVLVEWAGSIDATLAALKVAAAPKGGCAAAPSINCVKWWMQPSVLTADIRGEIGAGYVETVAGIAAAISAAAGGPAVVDLAAAIAARPEPAGLHIDDASERGVAALDRVLLRASMGWEITPAGALAMAPIAFDAPIADIVANSIEREAAHAPVTSVSVGWRRNHRIHGLADISAAVTAGAVTFADGTTVEDRKPATPGATAGAPVGTTIGGSIQPDGTVQGGKPVAEVLATLDRIEPIAEATDLLKRASIDQQALQRQATRDVGKLDQALLRALLESNRTREVMRDAGIVVDPATGRVRIHGVDQTSERVSKVEIDLDATKGRISLLASSDYVNEQIARAQLDPTGQGALDEIITRLTSAEIELDGLDAIVRLKADNLTVTTLGGRVVSVEQELDALAGEIALKASATDVSNLDTRVKQAELKLTTVGDMSALTIAVRQARYAADDAATGGLQALLSADTQHRRQLVAAAEARQELYTRLVDGDAAEATARQLLAAKVGAADARAGREESARIAGDRAQADALTVVEARIGEAAAAQATRLDRAIADGDRAIGEAIQQVTARLNGNGVTIEDKVQAIVEATGKITGTRTIAIDINGNMVGTQLVGAENGRGSLNLINADLRMGTGRVIFNTGTYMQVQGIGFGRDQNLLEWFGPTMAIDQCTRANAVTFKTVTGDAYFGGSLSAGTFRNTGSSTATQSNANIMIGPFRSNSRPRELVVSYELLVNLSITTACPVPQPANPQVTIDLFRGADANGALLTSRTMTGFYDCSPGAGANERGDITEEIRGAFTLTDAMAGETLSYFARIRNRQTYAPASQQTLSIISTEQ